MRALSEAFTTAMRAASRNPLVKLEIASFGHPAAVASTALQWSDYNWELLVSDATALGRHSVAMPADGSICRVRKDGIHIKYQRVTTPSSGDDWTTWADWGDGVSNNPIAIAAYGTEVIAFDDDGVYLYYKRSTDSGATFGNWTAMMNTRPCTLGCAAAFKANGDLAVVHATSLNDPTSLYIQRRVAGTWSTGLGQISGDHFVSALAMYHDGDWNILALLLDGSYIRLARGVYGDGHDYSAGTWSGWTFINSYRARVDFSAAMHLRMFHTGRAGRYTPTYYEQISAVQQQQATDNLAVDDPYITYHASLGAVFSFAKDNKPWFYRLRPGTAFKDDDWNRAWNLDVTATYGLALCCDGTYLYAAAPNQVWRSALPSSWAPPTAGAGAGTLYAVTAADVIAIKETVKPMAPSSLEVTLDNSAGTYNSIGGGAASAVGKLKRGAEVTLSIGYAGPLLSVAGKYYVENLAYSRFPGKALFHINCLDAWGLLERYSFNRPVFWNEASDVTTLYSIIELVVQAVGGSLSYVSRSADITGTYPRLEVHTGENAAVVLRQLLALVPDVIYFVGLTGYIVNPLVTDTASYYLRFT
jgi:hypothetical protein